MITVIPRKITATSVNGVAVANDGSITLPVDSAPTTNSTNLVTSGGVKTELDALSARIGNAENPAQVWTDVSFTIPTSSWSLSNNKYTATVQSSSILATSGVFVNYDDLDNAITPIIAEESTGQVTFTTETIPSGTITGTFRIIDSVNGIVPMERGGTGVAAASKDNLLTQLGAAKQSDMTTAQTDIQNLATLVGNIDAPAQTALEVPFSIAVSSWSGSGPYTATINSSSIVTNSIVLQPNITGGFNDLDPVWSWERNSNNSITFTVNSVPTNTISGTIPVVLSINGVVPLARGGTGATTAAAALTNLGAVNKAGDTMTGKLNMVKIDNYPEIRMSRISNAATGPSTAISSRLNGSESQFRFCQRINDSSGWEYFRLPSTSTSLDTGVMYDIITTKNPAEVNSMKNFNSFSTIAELSTALNNALSEMPISSVLRFRIQAAATVGLFSSTYVYYGELYKGGSDNYSHVMFYSNVEYAPITGVKLTADWTFYRLTIDRTTTTTLVATLRDGGVDGAALATGTATIKRAQNFIDFTLSINNCDNVTIENYAVITLSSSLPSQIPAHFPIIIRIAGAAYFIATAQNLSTQLIVRGGDIANQNNPKWTFTSSNTSIYAHEFVAI